jgi:hypothetical protein
LANELPTLPPTVSVLLTLIIIITSMGLQLLIMQERVIDHLHVVEKAVSMLQARLDTHCHNLPREQQ